MESLSIPTPSALAVKRGGVAQNNEEIQEPYFAFLDRPVTWASLGARVRSSHLPERDFVRCNACRRREAPRRTGDLAMAIFYGDARTGQVRRTWVSSRVCQQCERMIWGTR